MTVAEVYTDGDGSFRIDCLRAGKYSLRAGGDHLLGKANEGYAFRRIDDILLSDDEQHDSLNIDLEKGGMLEGRVIDAVGEPVSSASIHVRGPGQASFQDRSECVTDGSGFYRYTCLMPGTWSVRVNHPEYAPFTQSGVMIVEGGSSSLNCKLLHNLDPHRIRH